MSLAQFVDIELRLCSTERERRRALAALRPLDRLAWLWRLSGGGDV